MCPIFCFFCHNTRRSSQMLPVIVSPSQVRHASVQSTFVYNTLAETKNVARFISSIWDVKKTTDKLSEQVEFTCLPVLWLAPSTHITNCHLFADGTSVVGERLYNQCFFGCFAVIILRESKNFYPPWGFRKIFAATAENCWLKNSYQR